MNLSDQTKFGLSKTIWIENYLHQEINQRKSCSKKLCYHFWLHRQDFICFKWNKQSSLHDFVCKFCWSTSWNSKCKFYFKLFSYNRNNKKKLLIITRNKSKKHDKILMLAKSKLHYLETLVSQALVDMEISHEEFNVTIRKKEKYERMKENVKAVRLWDWKCETE